MHDAIIMVSAQSIDNSTLMMMAILWQDIINYYMQASNIKSDLSKCDFDNNNNNRRNVLLAMLILLLNICLLFGISSNVVNHILKQFMRKCDIFTNDLTKVHYSFNCHVKCPITLGTIDLSIIFLSSREQPLPQIPLSLVGDPALIQT